MRALVRQPQQFTAPRRNINVIPGPTPAPRIMTKSRRRRPNKQTRGPFAPRAIEAPEAYSCEERDIIFSRGLQYGRALKEARQATNDGEKAEAFRRKVEIIQIFRDLPDRLRKRPTGEATQDAVLNRLEQIGIRISERTLMRDYAALGGAKFLRGVKPFAPGEDRSSPLQAYRQQAAPGDETKALT
jgi:hypothetical protein